MFNNDNNRKSYEVQMLLSDGRSVDGTLMLPMSSDIKRVLGGDSPILEFMHKDGRESMIAKAAVVEIIVSDNAASEAAA
ncbi:MAG: hypothetical protein WBN88_17160 [Anderseniella sp.]|jgi:hypothetical protein